MRILAVTNQKGGVGKTTTSVNLAASLAYLGQNVLLIDLDPQGNATMGSGVDKREVSLTAYACLMEKRPLSQVAIPVPQGDYRIVPSNSELTAAEVELLHVGERERRLQLALQGEDFDWVLIDCPPALNMLTVNALTASHGVIIPIQCEYYALEGLSDLLGTIEQVREELNPDLHIEGVVRTMYDPRNRLANEVSAQLERHFGDQLYRTPIPRNVRLAEAPSYGLPAIHYDPGSVGAQAYFALAGEILKKEVPAGKRWRLWWKNMQMRMKRAQRESVDGA
ncbi:MAG: ParA family protein [Gammaproteobacteria bacterium]|nr:MAG: ParA family protein [Gammaproteobacteria bacterium]